MEVNVPPIQTVLRWGLKGGWGVLDQAVFSGANFVLSIILARWLPPDQFGAYAIAFTVLVVAYQIYVSFLLDPMAVIGPSEFPDRLEEYFAVQLRGHALLTFAAGFVFVVVAWLWADQDELVRPTIFAMGIALPLLLLPWYLRRVFYILGRPGISVFGSLVYAAALIATTVLLRSSDALSSASAVVAMAAAGLLSGGVLLLAFGFRRSTRSSMRLPAVMAQNWRFGKWLVVSSIFIAFSSQAQIWIAADILGVATSGTLRAMQVIIQPMMLTITALTAVAVPGLSFEYSRGEIPRYKRKIMLLSAALLIMAIAFELALWLVGGPLEILFYGGRFSEHSGLLPIWGLIPLLLAYSSGIQAGLQSAQKPEAFLLAALLWTPISFGLGIWLTGKFGILGASWSAVLGHVIFVLSLSVFFWKRVYHGAGIAKVGAT